MQKQTGRKPAVTGAQVTRATNKAVKDMMDSNIQMTKQNVVRNIYFNTAVKVGTKTVQRMWRKLKIKIRKLHKALPIKPMHKQSRFQYAKEVLGRQKSTWQQSFAFWDVWTFLFVLIINCRNELTAFPTGFLNQTSQKHDEKNPNAVAAR